MKTIIPWYIWALLAVLMILLPLKARAMTLSATDESGNRVTLYEGPCEEKSAWLKDWHKAAGIFRGKPYVACWKAQGNFVVIFDEDGVVTPIAKTVFHKDEVI